MELQPKTKKSNIDPPPATEPEAPTVAPAPAQAPPPADPQARQLDTLLSTAKLLGFALSARALLFVALIGAFILGATAMIKGGWMSLLVLVVYGAVGVVPIAYLEINKRRD